MKKVALITSIGGLILSAGCFLAGYQTNSSSDVSCTFVAAGIICVIGTFSFVKAQMGFEDKHDESE